MTDRILDIKTAVQLGMVLDAAQTNAKIKWSPDCGETIYEGTARSIGTENFNFSSASDDVRDLFLRVTGSNGTEHALPVSSCMEWIRTACFAVQR